MHAHHLYTLHEHGAWATRRLFEALGSAPEEAWSAPRDVPFRSLHGTFAHLLSAEWVWRLRARDGVSPPRMLELNDVPTPSAWRARWEEESAALLEFVGGLSEQELERSVRYSTTSGARHETPLWQILHHLALHGMQHRAEAAVVLTSFGASPGDLDLIVFLREREDSGG